MPLYEYQCDKCGNSVELQLKVEEREVAIPCYCSPDGAMTRTCGNKGGFRLGEGGSVGWGKDGYGSTWGDIANARAGHKVYKD